MLAALSSIVDLLANPFALPAQKRAEIIWHTPITKRGKLKYTKDDWEQFDAKAEKNRSLFLREMIVKTLNEDTQV
ncbi:MULTISPECIES: hypothetical protein [Bacillaceae]|uniref:hypothetical protein n=1 Tax=Bacillaceae TaxID=186817 RepID=UPI0001DA4ABC|nr:MULTISPECIES: hypothetical protein [Bacillaceae]EFI66009.1 hypothetical protein BFZC1_24200 [Lysinibacillus fusiformis ZC1]MBU5254485.1 hypothetical protein [Lysinibacillus capsici]MCT1542101.1 hypothetical protein [Lysinibacillus capsici]MCT1573327.1 hypothetical protein [Lysinibacillus capsici]MCT1728735.1 hypothetical protein [Lysinibacillus capsici]